MTDTSVALDQEAKRYPLSFTQEWFLTMDQGDDGGPFGGRFVIVSALRITGAVDLAVLQGALDDVVARHEHEHPGVPHRAADRDQVRDRVSRAYLIVQAAYRHLGRPVLVDQAQTGMPLPPFAQ